MGVWNLRNDMNLGYETHENVLYMMGVIRTNMNLTQ